jgi:hypothetical protein
MINWYTGSGKFLRGPNFVDKLATSYPRKLDPRNNHDYIQCIMGILARCYGVTKVYKVLYM